MSNPRQSCAGRPAARLNRERGIVCLVTDRRLMGGAGLIETIDRAARAGVDLIQIRERDLDGRALVALVREAVQVTRDTGTVLLVNDRLDVALAAGADGVHLRGDSISVSDARQIVHADFIVGRSVHHAGEASAESGADRADYLIFGTVFPSAGKAVGHPVAGLAALRRVCALAAVPVLAIGGVSVERAPDVAAAGACGVAAIGLFAASPDLCQTVGALRAAFVRP